MTVEPGEVRAERDEQDVGGESEQAALTSHLHSPLHHRHLRHISQAAHQNIRSFTALRRRQVAERQADINARCQVCDIT